MTVDTGAAISGVPTGVADALIAAEQAVELQKRTVTLFAGYSDTFRTIRIKTIRVGCQVVPDVIAIVLNAQVIGLRGLGHSGRFTIDGYREQLILNDPIHPMDSPALVSTEFCRPAARRPDSRQSQHAHRLSQQPAEAGGQPRLDGLDTDSCGAWPAGDCRGEG